MKNQKGYGAWGLYAFHWNSETICKIFNIWYLLLVLEFGVHDAFNELQGFSVAIFLYYSSFVIVVIVTVR